MPGGGVNRAIEGSSIAAGTSAPTGGASTSANPAGGIGISIAGMGFSASTL
jgi:hypothetical protein